MDVLTLVALVVAVYAAVVATVLAVRELRNQRRGLELALEQGTARARKQVTITNHGARPITLIDLAVHVSHGPIPPSELTEETWPFPMTLHSGRSHTIRLSKTADMTFEFDEQRLEISAFDVQGTEYTRFTRRRLPNA